jgi:hypothetical protein
MKSKLILSFFLVLGSLASQEATPQVATLPVVQSESVKQSIRYLSAGVGPFPLLLPVFAGGYREQWNHHGVDANFEVATVVKATALKANLLYHYYFKPSLTSEFYVGGGVGGGYLFGFDRGFISPEMVFGKQYRNQSNDLRFFQLQISIPTLLVHSANTYSHHHHIFDRHAFWFPVTVLSYGIGF